MPRRLLVSLMWIIGAFLVVQAEPPNERPIAQLGVPRLRMGHRAVFAGDGKTFLGIETGGALIRHDATTGAVVERIELPDDGIPLEFSADGRIVLFGTHREFSVWDVAAKRRLIHFAPSGDWVSVHSTLSADGRIVATRVGLGPNDWRLSVWDVPTKVERTFAKQSFDRAALSPDGKYLLAQREGVECWEVATGKEAWTQKQRYEYSTFAPDGRTLLIGGGIWSAVDVATGKPRGGWKLPSNSPQSRPALAPDNETLVLPQKTGVVLWDLKEGRVRRTLPGTSRDTGADWHHIGGFAPDGKSVLTNFGTVQRWDLATGRPMLPDTTDLGLLAPAHSLAFSPDGKRLAATTYEDRAVRVWDLPHPTPSLSLRGHTAYVRTALFTPDNKRLLSGGGDCTVRVWDADTGRELKVLQLSDPRKRADHQQVGTMRIHADGRRVFVASMVGFDEQKPTAWSSWDLVDGRRLDHRQSDFGKNLIGRNASVINRPLSPDGMALFNETAQLVSADGKLLRPPPEANAAEYFWDPVLSPDGRFGAAQVHAREKPESPRYVDVWELATGRRAVRLAVDAHYVAFSPIAPYLVTADSVGLRVWNLITGEAVRTCPVKTRKILQWCRGLALSSDGRTAAIAMPDATIRLWDVSVPKSSSTPSAEDLARAWSELAEASAAKGYAASVRLISAPDAAVKLIGEKLRPVAPPPADRVKELVAQLADPQFAKRQAAERELGALGDAVEKPLREALLQNVTPETRKRLDALLSGMADSVVPTGEVLRGIRAVAVLEHIGTPEARRVLEKLATGVETTRLAREAKASLVPWPARTKD